MQENENFRRDILTYKDKKFPKQNKGNEKKELLANQAKKTGKQDEQKTEETAKDIKLFEREEEKNDNMPPVQPLLENWNDGQAGPTEAELQEMIVSILHENAQPMDVEVLYQRLPVPEKKARDVVRELLNENILFWSRKHKLALPEQVGYITGRFQATGRGFGFLIPDGDEDDVYIGQDKRNNAMNGDRVVVRLVTSRDSNHSSEGEVVGIQKHANEEIVGTLFRDTKGYYLLPDNPRLDGDYRIHETTLKSAQIGQKVVIQLQYDGNNIAASVKEVLGFPEETGIDVLAIIKDHGISTEFSNDIITDVKKVPQEVPVDEILRREDCRKMVCVTIDGADSKDFDDAISCERLSNGNYVLGVHIADVSHYIAKGSSLDQEAYERGTSVYFIDRVVPMLPEELSNGICSLNPRVDRLTLSCFMEFNTEGHLLNHRFSETVIRSRSRLVYEDVTALLKGSKTQRNRYKTLTPMLEMMHDLSNALEKRREERGSIDFEIPEASIIVDETGSPQKIKIRERGISNRMIESFMLACNETVAKHFAILEMPMAYRVHETPSSERIESLQQFLAAYNIVLLTKQGEVTPKQLQTIMKQIQGKPEEASISRVLLRSLQKARYFPENKGHFGLAAPNYCHFTSPIRRYPDLIVHRLLKELIHGQLGKHEREQWDTQLPDMLSHCSSQERVAMEAERDVDDLKKCEFMEKYIGKEFEGTISGITSFGIFVELDNTCEGLVRLTELQDDYYELDKEKYTLTGQNTRRVFRLGDAIKVRTEEVDLTSRRVNFSIVGMKKPKNKNNQKWKREPAKEPAKTENKPKTGTKKNATKTKPSQEQKQPIKAQETAKNSQQKKNAQTKPKEEKGQANALIQKENTTLVTAKNNQKALQTQKTKKEQTQQQKKNGSKKQPLKNFDGNLEQNMPQTSKKKTSNQQPQKKNKTTENVPNNKKTAKQVDDTNHAKANQTKNTKTQAKNDGQGTSKEQTIKQKTTTQKKETKPKQAQSTTKNEQQTKGTNKQKQNMKKEKDHAEGEGNKNNRKKP